MAVPSKLGQRIGDLIADNIKETHKAGELIEAFVDLLIITINNAAPESRNVFYGHAVYKLREKFYDQPNVPGLVVLH